MTRKRLPGDVPTRVAGLGDRWRVTKMRTPLHGHDRTLWMAQPTELHTYAMQARKAALFASHEQALAYAVARAHGASHHDVDRHEIGRLLGRARLVGRTA